MNRYPTKPKYSLLTTRYKKTLTKKKKIVGENTDPSLYTLLTGEVYRLKLRNYRLTPMTIYSYSNGNYHHEDNDGSVTQHCINKIFRHCDTSLQSPKVSKTISNGSHSVARWFMSLYIFVPTESFCRYWSFYVFKFPYRLHFK